MLATYLETRHGCGFGANESSGGGVWLRRWHCFAAGQGALTRTYRFHAEDAPTACPGCAETVVERQALITGGA